MRARGAGKEGRRVEGRKGSGDGWEGEKGSGKGERGGARSSFEGEGKIPSWQLIRYG